MLIDTDLSTLGQYLKVDKSSLITKGVASVRSPVTRLRESSFTIDHLSFCEATRTEFLKRYSFDQWRQNLEGEPVVVDEAMIEKMEGVKKIRDDMKTWEWMFGQTPEFSYRLEKDFSWGSVVSHMSLAIVVNRSQCLLDACRTNTFFSYIVIVLGHDYQIKRGFDYGRGRDLN